MSDRVKGTLIKIDRNNEWGYDFVHSFSRRVGSEVPTKDLHEISVEERGSTKTMGNAPFAKKWRLTCRERRRVACMV